MRLGAYWFLAKVQVFEGLLNEIVQPIHHCGEDMVILESFRHLSNIMHNSGESYQEDFQLIGLTSAAMNSLSTSICITK